MKIGLVGFAGSGKTTVFNTLTGLAVPTGFGGEVHLGTVKVPDERIDALSRIFKPKKTTFAEIVFSDIPGEHTADSKSLSSKALDKIRDQDVLCLVVRGFENPALESAPDRAVRGAATGRQSDYARCPGQGRLGHSGAAHQRALWRQ